MGLRPTEEGVAGGEGMESTAQYGKPVGLGREPHFPKLPAQAHSNRAPSGRKHD